MTTSIYTTPSPDFGGRWIPIDLDPSNTGYQTRLNRSVLGVQNGHCQSVPFWVPQNVPKSDFKMSRLGELLSTQRNSSKIGFFRVFVGYNDVPPKTPKNPILERTPEKSPSNPLIFALIRKSGPGNPQNGQKLNFRRFCNFRPPRRGGVFSPPRPGGGNSRAGGGGGGGSRDPPSGVPDTHPLPGVHDGVVMDTMSWCTSRDTRDDLGGT